MWEVINSTEAEKENFIIPYGHTMFPCILFWTVCLWIYCFHTKWRPQRGAAFKIASLKVEHSCLPWSREVIHLVVKNKSLWCCGIQENYMFYKGIKHSFQDRWVRKRFVPLGSQLDVWTSHIMLPSCESPAQIAKMKNKNFHSWTMEYILQHLCSCP